MSDRVGPSRPKFCDQCGAKLAYEMCPQCPGQSKPFTVRPLSSITHDERDLVFDDLYELCSLHAMNHFVGGQRCACECDCRQYIFEAAMQGCLGKDIFDKLNKHEEYYWPETPTTPEVT